MPNMSKWQVLKLVPVECQDSVNLAYEGFRDMCRDQYRGLSLAEAAIEFCKWRGDIA